MSSAGDFHPNIAAGSHRTWLCSVVFLDIIDYSKTSVRQQVRAKGRLNELIAEAIREVDESSRVILDTGDGAAICFLGDPEDALVSALALRNSLNEPAPPGAESFAVRIGINLGPVKLVKDLNGNINAIGDGINDAQRVMSFAGPRDVLVSRSFYDVVGRISEEINQMFNFVGVRKDKHVREHAVYCIGPVTSSGDAAAASESAFVAPIEPPPTLASALPVNELAISEEAERAITARLARHIGPFAGVVVAQGLKSAHGLDEFVVGLGEEIDDVKGRAAFLAEARQLVKRER